MDKKTLPIIIILVIAILAYWPIVQKLGLVEEPQPPTPTTDSLVSKIDTVYRERPMDTIISYDSPLTESDGSTSAEVPEEIDLVDIDTIRITTNKFDVLLSNRGGGPVSVLLKEYTYRGGGQVQMMPGAIDACPEFDFSAGDLNTRSLRFTSSLEPGEYDATRHPLEVVYTYTDPRGGKVIRTLTFHPDRYHFDLHLAIEGQDRFNFRRLSYDVVWNNSLGVTEPDIESDYEMMSGVAMSGGSHELLDDFDNGQLDESLDGVTTWAGVRSKYFAAAIIPRGNVAESVRARGTKRPIRIGDEAVDVREVTVGLSFHLENVYTSADSFTVFVGPLDYLLMADYDVDLEAMLDIGTTPVVGWIIKPFAIAIIWLLPKIYSVFSNYGVVIILFALLVKFITLPLSLKSFASMNKMKELQPKLEELKKKNKKDPKKLNSEMMQLYKKHGVNPISGCLPIIPQMPLFFALFAVFRSTILLRDAPFVWFINDLSRGATGVTDPYILLVILMVITQFVSQRLTMPSTQQNKALMMMMPLFFGFIFYNLPAGLVLYWTCFSLFSLFDYFIFRKRKNVHIQPA